MLKRRDFMKLSTIMAAGAILPVSLFNNVEAITVEASTLNRLRPILHLQGHKKSGCAFHPELIDLWAGGGAALPDFI